MANESFIFYQSFCDTTDSLSDEDYGRLMRAVHKYGIHGIEPDDLSPMLMMAFGLMKPQIDANNRRRIDGRINGEKGSGYGKLGGRPKKEKPPGGYDENPLGDNAKPPNDNVNDNDNVNENVNVNGNENKELEWDKPDSSSPVFESDPDPPKRGDFPKAPDPPRRPDPKQASPPGMILGDAARVWETIRKAWNSRNCRFTCDKIYLNLSQNQRERVRGSMATYAPDQMVRAINRYFDEREAKPGGYEYKSFYLFIEKGLEFYAEA